MKLYPIQTLKHIASLIDCSYVGDDAFPVTGINEIHRVEQGDICFVDHPKYYEKALKSKATIIIIDQEVACPEGKALIISPTPFAHYNWLTNHFLPVVPFNGATSPKIDASAIVMPGAIVHQNVTIGPNTMIYPGVVVYAESTIGANCIIHANTVIGSDAFYYNKKQGKYTKMHSCGSVEIADNVEIGAGCTIDRGVSAPTKIGSGTKIDNHIHIAHDVVIGENCLLAASTAIAGCVSIEDNVTIWGQVAISSGVTIGAGAEILAKSGVNKNLEGGKRYFGSPAEDARTKMKEMAALKRLANQG